MYTKIWRLCPERVYSILPGGQPGAAAVENLGQQNGTSLTWPTDQPAGKL
jgi:hypothetical protein